jgi:hypothetical protein
LCHLQEHLAFCKSVLKKDQQEEEKDEKERSWQYWEGTQQEGQPQVREQQK